MVRIISARQQAIDITIASLFVLLCCAYGYQSGYQSLFDITAAFGLGAAMALRRFSPPLALIVAWVMAGLQLAFSVDPGIANLAILAVLYATAAYGDALLCWLGFASALVGAALATLYFSPLPLQSMIILLVGFLSLFVLSWVLGFLARIFTRALASRADQLTAENERLLAEQAVFVEQERNRIARDMHDIVAHSLAVVIAQADGARYVYSSSHTTETSDVVEESLTTIATTARSALADVRVLLGELRHNETGAPQPGLNELDALISHFETTGLNIQVSTDGTASPLGASRELAAYRIVQEALTNALRHGDCTQAVMISLHWQPTELMVVVKSVLSDPDSRSSRVGNPTLLDHAGHGIAGMIERATLVGGTLQAAPSGTQFVVSARLPTPPLPPTRAATAGTEAKLSANPTSTALSA